MRAPIYSFKTKTPNGEELNLGDLQGNVLLIVNTASRCGFTPQYAGLENLYRTYQNRGFVVMGFPCNQFGHQEPGTDAEIGAFCQKNYGISFPLSEKIRVNGPLAHPLYQYLTRALPGVLGTHTIKWNFTKFLVNRRGEVVRRYGPMTKPENIAPDIEALLE